MDTLHRLSALSVLLGLFFFVYGLILFHLRLFLASLVLLWLGVAIEQDIAKRQRLLHHHTEPVAAAGPASATEVAGTGDELATDDVATEGAKED